MQEEHDLAAATEQALAQHLLPNGVWHLIFQQVNTGMNLVLWAGVSQQLRRMITGSSRVTIDHWKRVFRRELTTFLLCFLIVG